jgi:hypothetical protein
VRFCFTLLTTTLVSLMLSGCLFIPIPIGMVYPATTYQKPDGTVTSGAEATPSTRLPDDKLAAKKDHQQPGGKKQKRIECKDQADKLLSDADRRAYTKECMSEER